MTSDSFRSGGPDASGVEHSTGGGGGAKEDEKENTERPWRKNRNEKKKKENIHLMIRVLPLCLSLPSFLPSARSLQLSFFFSFILFVLLLLLLLLLVLVLLLAAVHTLPRRPLQQSRARPSHLAPSTTTPAPSPRFCSSIPTKNRSSRSASWSRRPAAAAHPRQARPSRSTRYAR